MKTSKCVVCKKEFSYYPCNKSGKYCTLPCLYKSPEWLEKQSKAKLGKTHTAETRLKMSKSRKGIKQSKEWVEKRTSKGTLTLKRLYEKRMSNKKHTMEDYPEYKQIRVSPAYRFWRKKVLERDKNKCVECGEINGLEVDHIIPFASMLEEAKIFGNINMMFDISNGQTLCKECHRKGKTYCQKKKNQIEFRFIEAMRENWVRNKEDRPFKTFYDERVNQLIDLIKLKLK